VVDFAEAGGDRSELRRDAGRQFVEHRLKPLTRELAGAIDVGAFLKDQGDLREAELRDGADFEQFLDAAHLDFDGIGDEFFDFLGCERGHRGVDLHLDVGDVGHGIDGQPQGRPGADE
jgi:hypothetical protein